MQIYIDNDGIRHITDPEVAKEAAKGKIIDPKYVYFATTTKFEAYDPKYKMDGACDLGVLRS